MSGYYKKCRTCSHEMWVSEWEDEAEKLCGYCESGGSEKENDRLFREYYKSRGIEYVGFDEDE